MIVISYFFECVYLAAAFIFGLLVGLGIVEGKEITRSIFINGIECVYVNPGKFVMESRLKRRFRRKNETEHSVIISKGYWIGKYEITQEQYRAIMNENPSRFKDDNKPVESITWDDADKFCKAVGGRLPTEAEWEFAAKGAHHGRSHLFSGSNFAGRVAWYAKNSDNMTHHVGTKNHNEIGIYDMSGNVCEWVSDWYGDFKSGTQTDPYGPDSGIERVWRGGSWSHDKEFCRIDSRHRGKQSVSSSSLGFRIVFDYN